MRSLLSNKMVTYTYIVKRVEKKKIKYLEGSTLEQKQRQPAGMIRPQEPKTAQNFTAGSRLSSDASKVIGLQTARCCSVVRTKTENKSDSLAIEKLTRKKKTISQNNIVAYKLYILPQLPKTQTCLA